jgi:hypothetical protein
MSAHEEIDHARGWLFVEKLLAEEDARRVESLTDEELDKELRAGGYDPALVPSAEDLLARVEARATERAAREMASEAREPARVVVLSKRRPIRLTLLLVAAMFALLLVVMAARDPAVVAFFKHDHPPAEIGPDNEWAPLKPPAPPTPAQKEAEALRDEAVTRCDHMQWSLCRFNLDYAKALDPAGEDSPRVQKARSQLPAVDETPYSDDKPPGKKPNGK